MSLDNIMTKADLNVLSDEIKSYVSDRVGGEYTDYTKLLNLPTLGTAAAKDVASSGNASASQVVLGNDSRLSDSRTPTAHNQASDTITAMTGYSKPSSASAIATTDSLNTAIGKLEKALDTKGTSNLELGETSSTAYRGDRGKTAYDHSQSTHAPTNAEENQNAFSNITIGDVTIEADSKTDTLTLIAGNNITLTPNSTNDSVTIEAAAGGGTDSNAMHKGVDYVTAGRKSGSTLGTKATAEGENVVASGLCSHAEGQYTTASGQSSHAEGYYTSASGIKSHTEGNYTTASGQASHAEGNYTTASGNYSHAEGSNTKASKLYSHAEGCKTLASGNGAHAEGGYSSSWNEDYKGTFALGDSSHSEGSGTTASGDSSHAEGYKSSASGAYGSHAEGYYTTASGSNGSHAEGQYTTASGQSSHAEGNGAFASNYYSHAEGCGTIASSDSSHAEGQFTTASGQASHAEGCKTSALGNGAHAEGGYYPAWDEGYRGTFALGDNSHSEGRRTTASGENSHAEGDSTIASKPAAHAEGWCTLASGSYGSHAEGYETTAYGDYGSHTEGYKTSASSTGAHAEGYLTTASGGAAHAEGQGTTASNYASHAGGHYNAAMTTGGSINNTTGTAFVIGNGNSSFNGNAFSVQYDGTVKSKSTITASTTADYAEYFEWSDENPNKEDRVGHFVTFDEDNKIRIATSDDDYILGIVSGEPFVLGNGDCDVWNGMVIRDNFRRVIYEPAPLIEIDPETGKEHQVYDEDGNPIYQGTRPVYNPEYDPTIPYINRADRPEWAAIGMLGVLAVLEDGTCEVNGYCTIGENGIATKATKDSINKYRVIHRNSNDVIEIVFR